MATTTISRKTAAESFLKMAASGDVRLAFDTYVGEGFRHHNAFFPGNTVALIKGMEDNARQYPEKTIAIKRSIEDGDQVAVLSHVRMKPGDPGFALVHIFRFDQDRIIELWDIAQPIPKDSPNANGMF